MASSGPFEVWAWMASLGFFTMLAQFIPREYISSLRRFIKYKLLYISPYTFCDIHELDNSAPNKLYQDVQLYLSSLTFEGVHRVNMCKSKTSTSATLSLANDEEIMDNFQGAELRWVHSVNDRLGVLYYNFYENCSYERRKFTLRISKKDKDRMFDAYIGHIEARAKLLESEARELLLYTNIMGEDYSGTKIWDSVSFLHPANFDTLGLDGDIKSRIIKDLESFACSEKFYSRVGKAWKRGYLLYGPPGTGKSSMIAAIANKMRYDVYDLELTEVESNAQLRRLLLQTSNQSVVVIEDIDCSLDHSGQRNKDNGKKEDTTAPESEVEQSKVTLSGLLNFVDGLWSGTGSERIFIFTTNFQEKLDPALLRAGRMDMHIHLSYCTFSAFKVLARNYLQVSDHEMFEEVECAFRGSYMTPAEVTEVLIRSQKEDVSVALQRLIESLGEHREGPSLEQQRTRKKEMSQQSKKGDETNSEVGVDEAKEDADQ